MTAPPEIAFDGQTPCPLDRQPARLGGVLCNDHSRAVAAALDPDNEGDRDTQQPASIPVYWERLDATPGKGGDDTRRAPGFRSTPPGSLTVMAMRDRRSRSTPVVDVWYGRLAGTDRPDLDRPLYEQHGDVQAVYTALAQVASQLADHLGIPDDQRAPNGDVVPGGVPGLSAWLHAHVDDLTAHPQAAQAHEFLARLVDQLRNAAGDPRDKPVGRCIELITIAAQTERIECGANLYLPPPRPGVEVPADEPVLTCKRCRRRYAGRDLIRLRLANERDERAA